MYDYVIIASAWMSAYLRRLLMMMSLMASVFDDYVIIVSVLDECILASVLDDYVLDGVGV